MSFDDNIFSREQGTSAELYIFTFSNGTTLYFTSFERDLLTTETWDGHAYVHLPIRRSEFENDDALASNKMQITAPVLNTFASSLISGGQINVTITKMFLSDKTYQSIFNGLILSIEKNIGEAIATCASKMYFLEKELPRVFFQAPCNNTLFDSKCALLKTNWKYDSINVTISNNGYTATISDSDATAIGSDFYVKHGFSLPIGTGNVKAFWTLGQITYAGEIRYITNQNNKVLQIHYPFTGIKTGVISVNLLPGCDKTGFYCLNIFNNIVNFTGMPYMPANDPTVIAVET
jgi:hypothetical protein